jgi:hypothetical protein
MIRGIALAAVMVSIATIGLVAITRPEVFGQVPGEPGRSILQESAAAQDAASGNENALRQAAAPAERGASSPHDSPEALYAEFVAACAQEKCSHVAACLSPEFQTTWATLFVVGAIELEFDAQLAEPVRKALATHGIDPAVMPAVLLGADYGTTTKEEFETRWKKEVMPRIRDVPALIADLEPLLRSAAKRDESNSNVSYVLSTGAFGNQKYGFLRGLNVERDSATATVRVQRTPIVVPFDGAPPPFINPTPQTAWMKITFTRIDGKWYLASFDNIADESAASRPAAYDPRVNNGPPVYEPPIAPSAQFPLPGPPQ